jgi:hypothetical protein
MGANIVLIIDKDAFGMCMYTVCNKQGICLIRTSSWPIAEFVEQHSNSVHPELRLRVGGDEGTRLANPLWTHVRKFKTR